MTGREDPTVNVRPGSGHIVVIGDFVLDLIAEHPGTLHKGSDTLGRIVPRPGGSAANTATWLARLGLPVEFSGRVGADPLGDALIGHLRQEGVTPHIARDREAPTGTIVALIDPDGERSLLISPGANHRYSPENVPADRMPGAALLHLTGYSYFWDTTRAAAERAFALARQHGVPISVDASSASLLRAYGPEAFLAAVAGTACFLCNLDEGRVLTGLSDPDDVLTGLAGRFPVVGLKLGPEGSMIAAGDRRWRQPAVPVTGRLDTTGCGDAWDAGFLAAWVRGHDLPSAARLASAAAAWVAVRTGAVPPGWTAADRERLWAGVQERPGR